MIDKIVEYFNKLIGMLNVDYVLYGAAGLTLVIFLIMVFASSYPGRFAANTKKVVKAMQSSPEDIPQLDKLMADFPGKVPERWKKYRATNAGSVNLFVDSSTCVEVPLGGKAVRGMFIYGMITFVVAILALVLNIAILGTGALDATTLMTPIIVLVLGAIFTVILNVVAKSRYKKTLQNYYELSDTLLLNLPRIMPLGLPAPSAENAYMNSTDAQEMTTEQLVNSEFKPEPPVMETHSFAPPVLEEDADKEENTISFTASEIERSEESPYKEDIVARIERITREGASKQTMLEVAKLLNAERQKPENKNPEQKKRLDNALITLLKAISASNKQ